MKFTDLGLLPELLKAIDDQGYDQPSPIQARAIPEVLAGKDVMAAAQTGTGKTAGFTLPILQHIHHQPRPSGRGNHARVLILTPTRELAAQVAASVETYSRHLRTKTAVVFGGVKINPQMQRLRGGVDVLIATPGRLLDLQGQNAVQLDRLEVLILDEADRMMDMGFMPDLKRIVKLCPKKRQTLMFSATFSKEIRGLAQNFLYQPVEVSVSPPNSTVKLVQQRLIVVEKAQKTAVLVHLINTHDWYQVLVFSRTKHGANKLAKKLDDRGITSSAIHGNKSQGARTRALADFKSGKLRVLVATDIAARGIDISSLPHVVNFDLPQVAEDYVHRIGRTGRAGASGEALSLVSHDEFKLLVEIEKLIKQEIPREELDGFEPLNQLPSKPPAKSGNKKPGRRPSSASKPAGGRRSSKPASSDKPSRRRGRRDDSRSEAKPFARKRDSGVGEQTSAAQSAQQANAGETGDQPLNRRQRRAHLQPDGKPKAKRPGGRGRASGNRDGNKPGGKSFGKPSGKPGGKPSRKSGGGPSGKPSGKSGSRAGGNSARKQGGGSSGRPGQRSGNSRRGNERSGRSR